MNKLLPWHQEQWKLLIDAFKSQRLGHALLLRGREGFGVPQFARRLATALVCRDPQADNCPCGTCQSCALTAAGSHPDLIILEPEGGRTTIGIVQVRRLVDAFGLAPKLAGPKVAFLSPAESLTREAANCLLKTLEEPPGDTVFLLASHSSTKVPATVRSRCQLIVCSIPRHQEARRWLAEQLPQAVDVDLALDIAGGAPLRALDVMTEEYQLLRRKIFGTFAEAVTGQADPLAVAQIWRMLGTKDVIQWLSSFTADCIKVSQGATASMVLNRDLLSGLVSLVQTVEPRRLYELWDHCIQLNRDQSASTGLNDQLLLEGVAMSCTALSLARKNPSR